MRNEATPHRAGRIKELLGCGLRKARRAVNTKALPTSSHLSYRAQYLSISFHEIYPMLVQIYTLTDMNFDGKFYYFFIEFFFYWDKTFFSCSKIIFLVAK